MVNVDKIIKQLLNIYYLFEHWHASYMPYDVAYNYHKRMYDKGNIIVYMDENEEVIGYIEFWKVNASQFSRICNRERFNADGEDTNNGNICYVSNIWVKKSGQEFKVAKYLKTRLLRLNSDCSIYAGHKIKDNRKLRFYKNIHKGVENGKY